jgi:3-oxoacyl-[acyl-carrier protein] reductase
VYVGGSSRGVGLAIAEEFLAEGARVALSGRNTGVLDASANRLASAHGANRVLALGGDLGAAGVAVAHLDAVASAWGGIDVVVANAGSGRGKVGWDVSREGWEALLGANLFPAVELAHTAVSHLKRSTRGPNIVLIGSIAGLEALGAPLPYGAAKAALAHYEGIRVNVVAPGNILFPGGSWEGHLARRGDEVRRMIDAEVPLKRFGTPDEIAAIVVFLASPRAAFVTGSCVVADGGQTRS